MKLLIITDSYPPYHTGGYELRCQDVVERLRSLGHEIRILSTIVEQKIANDEPFVSRPLHKDNYNSNIFIRIIRELKDLNHINKEIKSFQPDAIYLWHIINLSKAILPYLTEVSKPIIFDEGGKGLFAAWSQRGAWYYLIEHKSNIPLINFLKSIFIFLFNYISNNKLKKTWIWPNSVYAYFNSNSSRKWTESKMVTTRKNYTIHSGINAKLFYYQPREKLATPLRIIVPGRITHAKRIGDIIPFLEKLEENNIKAKVIIVGNTDDKNYYQQLLNDIEENKLNNKINIKSMVTHEEMVKLYQDSDICFFPSVQEVGLSRIPLEAMACGSLVVTYGAEGSSELVKSGVTGYVINKNKLNNIIKIIKSLINQPEKYNEIIQNARAEIVNNHTLDIYVSKINDFIINSISDYHCTN